MTKIKKKSGVTDTEQLLAKFCNNLFLDLWSYPNPYKKDGKELCDLIAIFEDHVFLFFDRSRNLENEPDGDVTDNKWERWKRKVISKQLKTASGAERYIKRNGPIYLDENQLTALPIKINIKKIKIHKFIIAHGAATACRNFSKENISGSLAISYSLPVFRFPVQLPFHITLDKRSPVHIFDEENLGIILKDLDTFPDFLDYILEKEYAIKKLSMLSYCAEEDLLAFYYNNFNERSNKHYIYPREENVSATKTLHSISVGEGEWNEFIKSKPYKSKKESDKISYFWDEFIRYSSSFVLDGTSVGDKINDFNSNHQLKEMAKEPRFSRRDIAKCLVDLTMSDVSPGGRLLKYRSSIDKEKGYVFLLIRPHKDNLSDMEYEKYRSARKRLLVVACGAAKNKMPHLTKLVGIAVDYKSMEKKTEDFCLLDCSEWTKENRQHYENINKTFGFFKTAPIQKKQVSNFPEENK